MDAMLMDVKRFAVHDGPGIRTTLFLKGCSLKCIWCHNPEGIGTKPQMAYYEHKCIGCGECVSVCAQGAQKIGPEGHRFDRSACAACGACEPACLGEAMKRFGRRVTLEEALTLALEDAAFYGETGGVTLSGGEPLLQPYLPDLVQTLLAVDDPRPLRVEIETNGSRDLSPMAHLREACAEAGLPGSLHFTVDWKTPTAGEAVSAAMRRENYDLLDTRDAVKFVVGTEDDLAFMERCADEAGLWDRCSVLASPVWGAIEPAEIAAYLIDHGLDRARLQLQLHKIIWPDETRGV